MKSLLEKRYSFIISIILVIISSYIVFDYSKDKYYKDNWCEHLDVTWEEENIVNAQSGFVDADGVFNNEYSIKRKVIDGLVTDSLYCYALGATSLENGGNIIVAPYTRETGCIYTDEVCEMLTAEGTEIIKADLSKCR